MSNEKKSDFINFLLTILIIATIVFVLYLIANAPPRRNAYVISDRGLMRGVICINGLVMNWEDLNIYDEDGLPMKCSGVIELSNEERAEWEANHK